MDIFRELIIWFIFLCLGLLAVTLRSWFLSGRIDSFKTELKVSLVVSTLFAIIAAVIIHINN
jgi:hypothetical protein